MILQEYWRPLEVDLPRISRKVIRLVARIWILLLSLYKSVTSLRRILFLSSHSRANSTLKEIVYLNLIKYYIVNFFFLDLFLLYVTNFLEFCRKEITTKFQIKNLLDSYSFQPGSSEEYKRWIEHLNAVVILNVLPFSKMASIMYKSGK